jgi:hypothetical protein
MIPPTTYRVAPSYRCHLPGKVFRGAQQALQFARECAAAYRTSFAVYRVQAGRSVLLWRFDPS